MKLAIKTAVSDLQIIRPGTGETSYLWHMESSSSDRRNRAPQISPSRLCTSSVFLNHFLSIYWLLRYNLCHTQFFPSSKLKQKIFLSFLFVLPFPVLLLKVTACILASVFHLPLSLSISSTQSKWVAFPTNPLHILKKNLPNCQCNGFFRDSSDLTLLSTWPHHSHSSATLFPPWYLPGVLVTSLAIPLAFLGSSFVQL